MKTNDSRQTSKAVVVTSDTEDSLDPVYSNPEYCKAADHLIGVIRDRIVRVKAESYSGDEVLRIANKILESRMT